jgi:hypothetical protein
MEKVDKEALKRAQDKKEKQMGEIVYKSPKNKDHEQESRIS